MNDTQVILEILKRLHMSQTFIDTKLASKLTEQDFEDQPTFQVRRNDKGEYILREFFAFGETRVLKINLESVSLQDVLPDFFKDVEKHLVAGNFDSHLNSSKELSGQNMEEHLRGIIDYIEKVKRGEIEQESLAKDEEKKADGEDKEQISIDDETRMKSVIKRGQRTIFPEKAEQWEEFVTARFGDLYNGKDAEDALEIIEALSRGAPVDEAKKMIDDIGASGYSYGMIRRAILIFSNRGPDFWKSTTQGHISLKDRWTLYKITRENRKLEKLHKFDLPAGEEQEQPEAKEQKNSWEISDDEMQIVNEGLSEIAKKAGEQQRDETKRDGSVSFEK